MQTRRRSCPVAVDARPRPDQTSPTHPSGAAAALAAVDAFCDERLRLFADKRNDPNIAACSDLSPYLHFGQLSAQRMALRVKQHAKARSDSVASFLEESIVRRELSDNFCHYEVVGSPYNHPSRPRRRPAHVAAAICSAEVLVTPTPSPPTACL